MNVWDAVILLAVAAVVLWGVRAIRKGKIRCGGDCASCSQNCEHRTKE